MAWSAMSVVDGKLVKSAEYPDWNMNIVVANTLFGVFGGSFIFVAVWLGVFGAVVGGSEASSNVMFYQIQKGIADKIWSTDPLGSPLSSEDPRFLTNYGAHAVGGGVASAITPSKINNAAVTIGQGADMESRVMRNHLLIVIVITFIVGVMNGVFILLNV
jgi:lactate permease